MTSPTVTQEVMIATKDDISRLEVSIKELTAAVKDVVLIQERQTVQGKRIGDLETECGVLQEVIVKLEKKVDGWINRTVGAWFVITILGAVVVTIVEVVRK